MPRIATGGTAMWCPECEKLTTCKGASPTEVAEGVNSGRRFYQSNHSDVHFFRRGRICLNCGHRFLTAETRESFLDELVELRDSLSTIKRDTEQYLKDSNATSASLTALNSSLTKLRALKVYQQTIV